MKIKTFLWIIVAILSVVAIASLVLNISLLNYSFFSSPDGLIDNSKIVIAQDAIDTLDYIYVDDLEYEIPVCLAGEIKNNEYIKINSIEMTKIVESNVNNVSYVGCPVYINGQRVIGTMHNHPNGSCRLSEQDFVTYSQDVSRGQYLISLKCRVGYVFYMMNKMHQEVE